MRFKVVLIVRYRQYGRLPGCDVTSENTMLVVLRQGLREGEVARSNSSLGLIFMRPN